MVDHENLAILGYKWQNEDKLRGQNDMEEQSSLYLLHAAGLWRHYPLVLKGADDR